MAINFPVLVIPPRPPELPAVPPPPTTEPVVKTGPHLRNDAFLSRWLEDFERVIKDAWLLLGTLLAQIDARLVYLETRVADTYTWGQRGTLTDEERIALPLRVVRKEKVVELTVAAEVPSTSGSVSIEFRVNGAAAVTLQLPSGAPFVAVPFIRELAVNDKIEAFTKNPGNAEDVVVQARCV